MGLFFHFFIPQNWMWEGLGTRISWIVCDHGKGINQLGSGTKCAFNCKVALMAKAQLFITKYCTNNCPIKATSYSSCSRNCISKRMCIGGMVQLYNQLSILWRNTCALQSVDCMFTLTLTASLSVVQVEVVLWNKKLISWVTLLDFPVWMALYISKIFTGVKKRSHLWFLNSLSTLSLQVLRKFSALEDCK